MADFRSIDTADFRSVDADDLAPSKIEHRCEELFEGETLVQKYNYIVYHFDCGGRYYWARTYTDEIATVSIYGPFDGRETLRPVSGPIDEAVICYLKRRFKEIQALGSEGYVTLWSR